MSETEKTASVLDEGKKMDDLQIRAAQLIVVGNGSILGTFMLSREQMIIGRVGGANDISINSRIVSSQHGMFNYDNGVYGYIDLASANGTIINGRKIRGINGQPSAPVVLKDGDILSVGSESSGEAVYVLFSATTTNFNFDWKIFRLTNVGEVSIGRSGENNIRLPSITVSRKHAVIRNNGSHFTISDLNSANGTIVNSGIINGTVELQNTDVIKIENSKLFYLNNSLVYCVPKAAKPVNPGNYSDSIGKNIQRHEGNGSYDFARQGGVQVTVNNISRIVNCKKGAGINGGSKKFILDHVSLTINPGELVAILGGSGAGKTTFMNCINGFEPATEGTVLINGTDLYKNYKTVKSSIGYVPQQDIVHDNLTLESMLTYTGRLRLPKDVTKEEMKKRVAEVLDMVDLTAEKDTFISKLSGGQRKRASIAVELISDPRLFFLDEPTSGLDPEAETNLMRQLKGLSSQKGKTVIVITHTLQNIRLYDKVIFLAPGGKLCFYGSPAEAQKFFKVDNLADAYEKISKDVDGYVKRFDALRHKGAA